MNLTNRDGVPATILIVRNNMTHYFCTKCSLASKTPPGFWAKNMNTLMVRDVCTCASLRKHAEAFLNWSLKKQQRPNSIFRHTSTIYWFQQRFFVSWEENCRRIQACALLFLFLQRRNRIVTLVSSFWIWPTIRRIPQDRRNRWRQL